MLNAEQQTIYVGQWWLPEQPDRVMHGTLQIGPHRPELELYEAAPSGQAGGRDRIDVAVLHGRSMGLCLTLLTAIETSTSTSGGDGVEEIRRQVAVGTVLIGDSHLGSEHECVFNRASLRLSNLDQWVNRTPYKWTTTPEAVHLLELPVLAASIPGCEVILGRATTSHLGRLTDSGFSSHELIELRFVEGVTLREMEYGFIRPLEQLLTLAAGSHCIALALRVGNDDGTDDPLRNWPLIAYSVRRKSSDQDQAERPVVRQHMRFGVETAECPPAIDFGTTVPRWYALQTDLAPVCDLIFSLRSDAGGYLQQQTFTIASAIEALHRGLNPQMEEKTDNDRARNKAVLAAVKEGCAEHHRWLADAIQFAHRRSYFFRVRQLLQDTDHVMTTIVGDEERWTQQLRSMRDGIGHALSPAPDDKTVDQMVAMLHSARLFAEIVLLRQLGLTDTECRGSLDHHWERENVRALVEKGFPEWFTDPAPESATPGQS